MTLAVPSLVPPNRTQGVPGPVFTPAQFAFAQTIRHRDHFLSGTGDEGDGEEPAAVPIEAMPLASLAPLAAALGPPLRAVGG